MWLTRRISGYYKNAGSVTFASGNANMVGVINKADYAAPVVYNGPPFTCPAYNMTAVTDPSGVQYIVGCGFDTTTNSFKGVATSIGFDDCKVLYP